MPRVSHFPLRELPLELREKIYFFTLQPTSKNLDQHILELRENVYYVVTLQPTSQNLHQHIRVKDIVEFDDVDRYGPRTPEASFALLRVNRQIHEEAVKVFHREFMFFFNSIMNREPGRFLSPGHLTQIRRIAISIDIRGSILFPERESSYWYDPPDAEHVKEWAKALTGLREVGQYDPALYEGPTDGLLTEILVTASLIDYGIRNALAAGSVRDIILSYAETFKHCKINLTPEFSRMRSYGEFESAREKVAEWEEERKKIEAGATE